MGERGRERSGKGKKLNLIKENFEELNLRIENFEKTKFDKREF